MDYFNISSELAKAKEPAFKSGMLKRYAKGGFTDRSEYKRSIENDIRVGMYRNGGPTQPVYPYNPAIIPNVPFLNSGNNFPVLTTRPIISNSNNLNIANNTEQYFTEPRAFNNQVNFPQTPIVPKITNVSTPVNNLQVPAQMQVKEMAKGGLIKRADGSYSRRGLWDNIRANRGSGKKPTKQMLEQEKKIKAKTKYEEGGTSSSNLQLFGKGGYRVSRTSERKGKTHKVTGPDGSVKYFGDPSMGERSKSKYGKDAFYKRHAKSLKKNPHFRAYAKATWSDGGLVSESDLFNLSSY